MIRQSILALTTAAIGVLSATTSAQCLGPDNLSGPCWQPTQANLPNFPQQALPGTSICYTDCVPQQECNRVIVGQPQFVGCGQYIAQVSIFDCTTGQTTMVGAMTMDYTRKWAEAMPTDELDVYRFAVKVTLNPGVSPGTPCSVPSCLPSTQRAFYYGYMDYAFHCSSPQVESAIMLFHNCDDFIHRNGISATPGVFHPNRSYAIVAPHTTANPFVAGIASPPTGSLISEAIRNVTGPLGTCTYEDRISGGSLQKIVDGCGCSLALNPKQLTARRLSGKGSCTAPGISPSSFKSVKTTPGFPWFHQMTNSIGSWTTAANYPGKERCWADEAPILFQDACNAAAGLPANWGEIYYGASTDQGYPIIPTAGAVASDKFLDLASNASFPLPGPVALPMVGLVLPTRNLIYVNTP